MRRWAFVVMWAAALAWPAAAAAQLPAGTPVVVLPFDNPAQEPRLAWMREGAAVLLTDLLAASGERVVDRDERLRAFDRLQLPAGAGLSRASSIKVGQVVAAGVVVIGTLELTGDQLLARGRVVRLDTGRLLPEVQAAGALADLFGIFSRLAHEVRGVSAAPPAMPSDRLPPSMQVFELYIKGLVAEAPATAILQLRDDRRRIVPTVWFHAQSLRDTSTGSLHCAEGLHALPAGRAGPALTSISAFEPLLKSPDVSLWRALRSSMPRQPDGWSFRTEQQGLELRGRIQVEPRHWVTLRHEDVRGRLFYRTSARMARLEVLALERGKPRGFFATPFDTWLEWTTRERPIVSPELR